jgi:hypothetical protein
VTALRKRWAVTSADGVRPADQCLRREERHLRVVGDRSAAAVRQFVPGDTSESESLADPVELVELDRCTERIPDRAAEQTTAKCVSRPRTSPVEHVPPPYLVLRAAFAP